MFVCPQTPNRCAAESPVKQISLQESQMSCIMSEAMADSPGQSDDSSDPDAKVSVLSIRPPTDLVVKRRIFVDSDAESHDSSLLGFTGARVLALGPVFLGPRGARLDHLTPAPPACQTRVTLSHKDQGPLFLIFRWQTERIHIFTHASVSGCFRSLLFYFIPFYSILSYSTSRYSILFYCILVYFLKFISFHVMLRYLFPSNLSYPFISYSFLYFTLL